MRLLLIIIFFPMLVFSQKLSKEERKAILKSKKNGTFNECLHRNTTDEFTGDQIIQTKEKLLGTRGFAGLNGSSTVSIKSINDNLYFVFNFSASDIFSVKQGDLLMLKTTEGNIVELEIIKDETADHVYIENLKSTIWSSKIHTSLEKQDIEILKNENISKYRLYLRDSYIENEIKKKRSSSVIETIKCYESTY